MNRKIKENNTCARADRINNESEAFFVCKWVNFILIHYEVNTALLQDSVPFELDQFEGRAYISLVAFTLEDFSFAQKGLIRRIVMLPVASHRYFNVRTYVKHDGCKGIYFLKEWISNPLCSFVGSRLYGLPCEYGHLDYSHDWPTGLLRGKIISPRKTSYQYLLCKNTDAMMSAKPDMLEDFLFERYTAFIEKNGVKKYFRIWHQPWRHGPVEIKHIHDRLLSTLGRWGTDIQPCLAHYSPGVSGVRMSRLLKLG